jgi:outer membrane protein insertion porin family
MGLPFLAVLLLSALPQLSILPSTVSMAPQDDVLIAAQASPPPSSGVIKDIRFVGLRRLSPEALHAHTSSHVGEILDQAKIGRDIRALAALGWFDFVTAEVSLIPSLAGEVKGSEVRLVFVMEERPFLASVQFHGSHFLSSERITQTLEANKIKLKLSTPLDRFELWRASRAIKGELEEMGCAQAYVRMVLEQVAPATVRARFEIEDGPRISVGQVAFVGNRAFSEDLLRSQMKRVVPNARFATLRDKNIYTQERLQEDLNGVAEYYQDHGYPEARVGAPSVEVRQNIERHLFAWPNRRTVPHLQISVPISEGTFYKLAAIEVHGDLPITPRSDTLIATSGLRSGEPYSQQKLEHLREALTQLQQAESFSRRPASEATESLKFDTEKHAVDASFSLRRSDPYTLRRLTFSGERRFSDRYYRRHIPAREGEPFDPKKLELGLQRLARTGYIRPLKPADVHLQFDEAHHFVDASIRVTEIGEQKITFFGGRSNLGNTVGIAYSVFNLLGGEELISSQIEGGPDSLHLALILTEEAILGSRASLSFTVFQNVLRPRLPGAPGNQHFLTSHSRGLGVGLGYPVATDEALTATYAISHQSTDYSLALPPSLTGSVSNGVHSNTSSHSFGLDWNGKSGGQHWDTSASGSGGWLGGDENLVRFSAENDRVESDPLTNGHNTWAFRSYAAGVSTLKGNLLFQNRYFAGSEVLRGFRSGEIAPYISENVMDASRKNRFQAIPAGVDMLAAVNTEYRAPVAPRTEAVGFFDAGTGWLLPNWLGASHPVLLAGTNGILRASAGVELRWQVPIVEQPLRLDFAVNPLRLAKSFVLPDGSHFHTPDRQWGWGWGLGALF